MVTGPLSSSHQSIVDGNHLHLKKTLQMSWQRGEGVKNLDFSWTLMLETQRIFFFYSSFVHKLQKKNTRHLSHSNNYVFYEPTQANIGQKANLISIFEWKMNRKSTTYVNATNCSILRIQNFLFSHKSKNYFCGFPRKFPRWNPMWAFHLHTKKRAEYHTLSYRSKRNI